MTDEVQNPTGEQPVENQLPVRPDNIPEKFWNAETGAVNTEALLASYVELEKKNSKPAVEGEPVVPNPDDQPNDPAGELPVGEAYAKAVEKANAELQSETGAISEETYADFAKQGISKEQIDTYVEGQIAMQELRKIHIERDLGGEEVYSSLLAWAGANYTAEEAEAYNAAAFGPSRDEALKAARSLKARYEETMGVEGKIITDGTGSSAPGGYANKAEWLADIRKPEYKKDPAAREAVRKKLEVSLKNGVDMGVGVSAG
jgi:hypothetical protein